MTKSLQVTDKNFNQAEIQLLRDTYAKGLDDTELKVFLKQAEVLGLNPFNKEIYALKFGNKFTLITSIGGLRKIAHRTNRYLGCKTEAFRDKDGKLVWCKSVVRKLVGAHVAEFEFTARNDEFNQQNQQWKDMEETMLSKCSEGGALRMAFPNIENLFDDAELKVAAITEAGETSDAMPNYENETQEVAMISDGTPPGEYLVKFKSHKVPIKIKDVPEQELHDFVAWTYQQENRTPAIKEALARVEAFLEAKAT